jgi:hypothetical protein
MNTDSLTQRRQDAKGAKGRAQIKPQPEHSTFNTEQTNPAATGNKRRLPRTGVAATEMSPQHPVPVAGSDDSNLKILMSKNEHDMRGGRYFGISVNR